MKDHVELRRNGNEWCALEVGIAPYGLSICGSAGYVLTRAQARKEALEFWESYFDDSPGEITEMGKRFGRQFRTAKGAARFVLATDGEYHGLDVYREDGNNVYVTHSCGQIREDLAKWFPECVEYFPYHLQKDLPANVIQWAEHVGENKP